MQGLQGVKAKDIAKYALLPGIIPRINAFLETGFGGLAFIMAQVYNAVRLLPNNHPYLNASNIGQFGIRHVIAESANNLVVKKENTDQIIIFFALLVGVVLLFLQCIGLVVSLIVAPALAGPGFAGLFTTATCEAPGSACTDIAHMLMDRVFGVPEMFNSKFAPAGTGFGAIPVFNRALQELFQYYNYAILIVGVFIFLYYVIVIVGETANTGTPFGRRFNHVYAPLRLVVAVGLLVPLNYGFNGAQYITLYAAKFGSAFATNSWIIFNRELDAAETPIGTHKEALIARPEPSHINHIVAFMSIVQTCRFAYAKLMPTYPPVLPYFVRNEPDVAAAPAAPGGYEAGLEFYNFRDVTIRFGALMDGNDQANYTGDVNPLCGEITIHTNVATDEAQLIGPFLMQNSFYEMVIGLWGNPQLAAFGDRVSAIHTNIPPDPCAAGAALAPAGDCRQLPTSEWKIARTDEYQEVYNLAIQVAYDAVVDVADGFYDIPPELLERGWGGAAIWYNQIAEWNGALVTASINTPTASLMPSPMEKIEEERRSHNEAVDAENRYEPNVEGFRAITMLEGQEIPIAKALSAAYRYWMTDGRALPTDLQTTGNVFFDLLNTVLGIGGLFTMQENDDVHPLAQLSALGKSMIESAIRNLLTALVFSAGGGMGQILGTHLGAALNTVSSMFVSFATIALAIGFILYYVLPFMPFMYFFFAVGGWVKSIFEAMVGTPLWALAHLRVDGNGFPGDTASNGYFLIFEIFVRPVLTLFGLIAGMAIFAAMARTLNGVFDLVVENLTGFDCFECDKVKGGIAGLEFKRNVIDEFFFTIIYTIILYMIATSSFKMIDQIPNSILRWMGAGVQSFGDQRDDPAQGMVQYAAFGGANLGGQVAGAMNQGANAMGQGVGLAARNLLPGRGATAVTGGPSTPSSGPATVTPAAPATPRGGTPQ